MRSIDELGEETISLVRTFQNRECYAQSPKVRGTCTFRNPKAGQTGRKERRWEPDHLGSKM